MTEGNLESSCTALSDFFLRVKLSNPLKTIAFELESKTFGHSEISFQLHLPLLGADQGLASGFVLSDHLFHASAGVGHKELLLRAVGNLDQTSTDLQLTGSLGHTTDLDRDSGLSRDQCRGWNRLELDSRRAEADLLNLQIDAVGVGEGDNKVGSFLRNKIQFGGAVDFALEGVVNKRINLALSTESLLWLWNNGLERILGSREGHLACGGAADLNVDDQCFRPVVDLCKIRQARLLGRIQDSWQGCVEASLFFAGEVGVKLS